jgi:hypothetical protein
VTSFQSVRSAGATGNGVTDDTTAIQNAINSATAAGQVVFFDAGTYLVTRTVSIPRGAKLVGESYSVIMSSGSYFNDMSNPKPVVQVGTPGQTGQVEWSDMIVSTQGTQAGAILIEWNLATRGTPSGMWDVHTRIGGFVGSNQQVSQCVKNPGSTTVNAACIVAYMSMHVTPSASGLYMENNWFWTAGECNVESISMYLKRLIFAQTMILMIAVTLNLLSMQDEGCILRVLLGHSGCKLAIYVLSNGKKLMVTCQNTTVSAQQLSITLCISTSYQTHRICSWASYRQRRRERSANRLRVHLF